jgi:NADPH:quinone reductase-like Zn-dependent oxidoreductase
LERDETVSRINSSELSQPSTTAIQIAIVDHLTEAGVKPTAVLGHSSGEVAAAYAAGILSQESAITISYHKGFVAAWCKQAATEKGAMLAAGLGEVEVSHYLKQLQRGTATVACVNSPSSVTISGDAEAVAELKDLLDRQSIFNRQLKVDIAYHSHHMRAIAERFHKAISEVPTKYPQTTVSFFSSVTGCERLMEVGPSYWVDNLISKVRFSEALEQLIEMFRMSGAPPLVLVEVGPHPALQSPLRQTMTSMKPEYPKWSHVSSLVRKKDSSVAALEMLGSLFEQGVCINVDTAPSQTQMLLDLEPYPWDHSNKYWHESRLSKEYRFRRHAPHDLLGLRLTGSTILEPIFRHILSVDNLPWLQEHIIDGFALYPGSAFLCMAIEGLRQTLQDRGETRSIRKFIFKDVVFSKALVIPDSPGSVETMISLKHSHYSNHKLHLFWEDFKVSSLAADGTWNEHCHGLVRPEYGSDSVMFPGSEDASVLAQNQVSMFEHQCAESLPSSLLYEQLRQNGIDYGDLFSIIKDLRLGHCKALGAVEIPDVRARMPSTHMEPHIIHPAVFDAFMHIVLPLYHRHCSTGPVMLTSIGEVSISADILKEPGSRLTVVCDLAETGRRQGSVDVTILQEGTDGRLVEVGSLSKEGFQGIGEGSGTANSGNTAPTSCYGIKWIPVEVPSDGHGRIATPQFQILYSPGTDSSKIQVQQLAQQLQFVNTTAPHCVTPASEAPSLGIMIDDATMVDWGNTVAREEALKALLSQSQKTLWMVTGIQSPTDPRLGMLDEIARDVRQDHPGRKIVTFCCDKLDLEDAAMLENVVKVIAFPLNTPDEGKEDDWQYFWHGGSLLVPRLMLDAPSTNWLAAYTGQVPIEEVSAFHRDDRTLELDFKIPGLLDSAVFVPSLAVMEDLEPDEVCIKVYAHTVSQKDVAIATGRDGTGATYVGEFAGTVTAAGSTAQASYAPGDRVCGWSSQPYTNRARVKSHLVQKIGDTMTFTEATSIPLAFQTAYHALVKVAQMQEGQTVLVHGAAGAVGQAALALVQHIGACAFATVSDEEKAYLLVRECAISRHQVFSNRSTSFKDNIMRATQGHGVDIVLNCSSEALLQESVSCVADLGILIDMTNGRRDIPLHEAGKNITFARVDMFHFAKQRRLETGKVFAEVMALYQAGKLRPLLPLTTMPITRIGDAFKLVQSQKYTGKVVLEAGDGVCVRQIARKPAIPVLDPNGTFVVVGGSITTNKMLCTYLASRGAKHITVISTNRVDEANRSLRSLAEELHAEIDICTVQSTETKGFLEAASSHASITTGIRGAICVETSDQLRVGKSSRSPVPPAQDYALDFLVTVACHENPLRGLHMSTPGRATAGISSLFTVGPEHRATLHIPVVGDNNQIRPAVELDALLDYCLSPSTEKDRPIQLYAGVETHHLSSMAELGLQQDPVTRAFLDPGGSTNADNSKAGKTGFEQRLMQCHSLDQAREMVTLALVEQLATFIAIDADDIRPTEPVAAVGLDSLLAIEFKNWIVRIFQAPMQTSEILDAASINELADLIVKRSRLVDKLPLLNGNSGSGMPHQNGNMSSLGLQAEPEIALTPPEDSARPPPLPIPELSALLERNLTYLRAFASEEEFHNSKRLAEEFQASGSMGRCLYDRLHALREADPEDWYANLYYRSQYLSRKGPLAPWINFFFTHPFSPVQHSQAERAAIITSVVVSYKKELEAGKVRPRYLNEQQLCMDLYKNLFNTSREPCVGLDIMHKHPDNNYFVVFRRGHVYRVDFDHDGDNTVARYAHLFDAILNDHLPVIDWLGVLTTDNRMSWAKVSAIAGNKCSG